MEKNFIVVNSFVRCRRIKPTALIEFADCEKCEFHGGVVQRMGLKNKQANEEEDVSNMPVESAVCKLPTQVSIERHVREA